MCSEFTTARNRSEGTSNVRELASGAEDVCDECGRGIPASQSWREQIDVARRKRSVEKEKTNVDDVMTVSNGIYRQ